MSDNKVQNHKHPYDVKIEAMIPAILTYRVYAENAEKAAEDVKYLTPNSVNYKLKGRKEFIISVYDAGSCMLRFIKHLFGYLV